MIYNEDTLIDRLKRGDTQAMRLLIKKYGTYVYTLSLRILKKKEPAEEAAQDVFIKIYRNINQFARRARFSTWIYTITYRTCLNYLQRNVYIAENPARENQLEAGIDESADTLLLNNEREKIIWDALDKIPETQARTITLYYLQQLSVNEISKMLNIPPNTVKTLLYRGRKAMADHLSRHYKGEEWA